MRAKKLQRLKEAKELGDEDLVKKNVRFEVDSDGNEVEVELGSDEEYDSDELIYDSEEEDEEQKELEYLKHEV